MGLDLSAEGSPTGPHWSYGGFMQFREQLAQIVGIPELRAMQGFGGDTPWDLVSTPLRPLLNHSDCEGDMTWQECATVAPELRRIMESWADDDWFGHDRQSGFELVELMEHCVTVQVPLEFG